MTTSDETTGTAAVETEPGLIYGYRPSMMGGASAFRLTRDALEWQVGRRAGRVLYRDIRRIRLSFRPVTLQTYRFIAEIWSTSAPKLEFASTSWRNMVEQERHDEAYRAFVAALHRRLADAGASPALTTGSPPLLYWPGAAIFVAMVVTMAVLVFRAFQVDSPAGALFIGGFLVLFLWQVGSFFRRNRPGTYRLDALPEAVLPRLAASPRTTSTEHRA